MLSRKAFTLRLWGRINAHCRKRRLFRDGDSILLAVSGGPDSVMMLDYFAKLARTRRLRLAVAHLNHKLRGADSDRDEAFVKKLGASYGLPTITGKAAVAAAARRQGLSVEHAARRSRYDFLSKIALEQKCSFVATAHHADDHTETVLLNLLRGTEPKGLLGIPVKRPLVNKGRRTVYVIRPLLAVTRKEILAYLSLNGLPSRRDKSNDDEKYTRNWLRRTVLPLIEKKQPRFGAHMLELSEKLGGLLQ